MVHPVDDDSISSDSDDAKPSDMSIDERLVRAESCKLSGNTAFREKDNQEALKFYDKGVDILKPLEDKKVPELLEGHVVKRDELLCSLLLNSAAALNREEMWLKSSKSCTKAEKHVAANDTKTLTKLHFRRGTACARMNDLDLAKKDFMKVIELEPKNKTALKELIIIRKKLSVIKAKERKGFGRAFSAGGMYDDKEEAKVMRERKEKAEKEQEEKEYNEAKEKWESNDEVVVSFDDWKVERKKKEKEEKERKEKKEKEEKEREAKRQKEREEKRKEMEVNPTEDEVELDDDDIAMLNEVKAKGYCHFRREQSEEEKDLLRKSLTPSRLEQDEAIEEQTTTSNDHSAWNTAGTWEEKNISEQAKDELRRSLEPVNIAKETVSVSVKSVNNINGDAQIVMVNGKRGCLYDLALDVKWEVEISSDKEILFDIDDDGDDDNGNDDVENEKKLASGTLEFRDISNGVIDQHYDCTYKLNNSKTVKLDQPIVQNALQEFESLVRKTIATVLETTLVS